MRISHKINSTELHCQVPHNWNYNWLLYYEHHSICLIIMEKNMNETQSIGQGWWCKFHQQWHNASKSSQNTSKCTIPRRYVFIWNKFCLFLSSKLVAMSNACFNLFRPTGAHGMKMWGSHRRSILQSYIAKYFIIGAKMDCCIMDTIVSAWT